MKYKVPNERLSRSTAGFFLAVLLAALVALVLFASGCASVPLDRQWQIASDGYTISLEGLNAAYDCKVVNETQFRATAPYQAIASEALDVMQAAALAKDKERYAAAKIQLKIAVQKISEVIQSWSK